MFNALTLSRGPLLVGLLAVTLLMGTGCKNQRLAQERAAYDAQNRELQEKLQQAYAARDALALENSTLRQELESARSIPAPTPSAGANSFAGIDNIEVIQGNGTVTVRVPGDVLFASGQVTLRNSAKATIAQIASVLNREYPANIIRVEGYTDQDPIRKSKWKDNLELSLQRAAAVHRELQGRGVSAERLYAAGFGEHKLQSTKAKSRRVEIVVVVN